MWRRLIAPRSLVVAFLAVAAVVYGLLSIVNHYCFHTFGLDLGLYTHALWDYAHLRFCDGSFYLEIPRNLLADHFDLYLVVLSPLVWVFGEYTLLVVQIVAILLGGVGVYKLVGCYGGGRWLPLFAMATFFSFFGIWQSLAFDYHSNVVACMLVPWLMYALRRGRYGFFVLLTIMVCLAKETLPLWMVFILLALMWDYRRNATALWWLSGATGFCLLYLLAVTQFIMPALSDTPSPGFWRYGYMGSDFGEVAVWLLLHPIEAVRNFFVDFTPDGAGLGLKLEFYCCLLLSCGLLCLAKPNWLLMLLPLVGQKMLACDVAFWGVAYHYNVECAVVVVPAAFIFLSSLKSVSWRYIAAVIVLLLTLLTTIYTTAHPRTWIRRENVRLIDRRHYGNEMFSCDDARHLIGELPADASVCASSCFTPHLALRDHIYLYPEGLAYQPEYLILTDNTVPVSDQWHAIDSVDGIIMYQRIEMQ